MPAQRNSGGYANRLPAAAARVQHVLMSHANALPSPLKLASSALAVFACLSAVPCRADEVTNWNEVATQASLRSHLADNPIFESRVYAMTFAAIHNALNAVDRRYRSYNSPLPGAPYASPRAAVAAAAHDVLADQFSQLVAFGVAPQQAELDAAYAQALASIPSGRAKDQGIALGRAAALAILELRANDGWNRLTVLDKAYVQGTTPGEYRFTPPSDFAFLPEWGFMPPFALRSGSQFRPGPPYSVTGRRYVRDYNEIKALGGDNVMTPSARTPEQTEIALFWLESSPIGWNRIARAVAASHRLSLWESGRLFALLNIGLADGYIGTFETKYLYKFWRPVTAIREGDSDDNPLTAGDPTWTPLAQTPEIPDYDSGHAAEGGVGAGILRRFFTPIAPASPFAARLCPPGSNAANLPSARDPSNASRKRPMKTGSRAFWSAIISGLPWT